MEVNIADLPHPPPAQASAPAEAVIPTAGDGRVGIIRGNTFTPLPVVTNGFAANSGVW